MVSFLEVEGKGDGEEESRTGKGIEREEGDRVHTILTEDAFVFVSITTRTVT